MKTFQRVIGSMTLSGEFFFVVVWHLVLISQWVMKRFEQKYYGGTKPLSSFDFKKIHFI